MEIKEINVNNGLLVKNIENFIENVENIKRTCPD